MLKKVDESLKEVFIDYAKKRGVINLFMIADMQNLYDEVEAWIQYDNDNITSLVLVYYDSLLFFSSEDNYDKKEIKDLIETIKPKMISFANFNNSLKEVVNYSNEKFCYFSTLTELSIDSDDKDVVIINNDEDYYQASIVYANAFKEKNEILNETKRKDTEIQLRRNSLLMGIKKDNKIVSIGAISVSSDTDAMIVSVATDEYYRKLGNATKLMINLCKTILKNGQKPCLFFLNPDAGKVYHKLGFKDIEYQWIMLTCHE